MSTLHKEYATLENGKIIKFSIDFNKSQYSWATSQPTAIGYRVSVTPIERSADGMWESFSAFTGFNDTLLEIDRQSKKRLEIAIKILQERKEMYLEQFKEGGRYAIKTENKVGV